MIRSTRTRSLGAATAVTLGLLLSGPAPAATHQDPKALAVVEALEKAIATDGGWGGVGGVRFTFSVLKEGKLVSEIHHAWNVRSGQYRVDWKDKEGQRVVLFNVAGKGQQGQAYLRSIRPEVPMEEAGAKKRKLSGEGTSWMKAPPAMEDKLLQTGYGRFINDTYWLLMPLKMRDPGVNLDYDGEERIGGHVYDVVKMTFERVGLTPGDTYWVYVNRDTHLIDRWEYVLEDDAAKADARKGKGPERTTWIWRDWQTFGPVKLATRKNMTDESMAIVLKNVEMMPSMPDDAFEPPMKGPARSKAPSPAPAPAPADEKPHKG